MRIKTLFFFGLYCIFISIIICEATTSSEIEPLSFYIEDSLPQSKLASYNDPFDELRWDLWEKSQLTSNKSQAANFKLANMAVKNGKLRIETKTNSFSKGGLISRYTFEGDFDIQIDCHIDFLKRKVNMDQDIMFVIMEKDKSVLQADSTFIRLQKTSKQQHGKISSATQKYGTFKWGKKHTIDNFHGTLRFVRKGKKTHVLIKRNVNEQWEKMNTFSSTKKNLFFAFRLQNFTRKRTSIKAEASIYAEFDNYKINAAQKIVEDEI